MIASGRWQAPRRLSGAVSTGGRLTQGAEVAGALHRCAALQLIVTEGSGFAFRHALTRDVILAELADPERCRLSLAAAEALAATARRNDDDHVLLTGRLLVDG